MAYDTGASLGEDVGARAYLPRISRSFTPDNLPSDLDQSPELKRLHEEHKARQLRMRAPIRLPVSAPPLGSLSSFRAQSAARVATVIVLGFWGYHGLKDEHRVKTAVEIIYEVARKYHVSVADLKGPRRKACLVYPRQYAMWRIRNECPHLSLPAIGRMFGNRDHTTVLHACRKMDAATRAPQHGGREI